MATGRVQPLEIALVCDPAGTDGRGRTASIANSVAIAVAKGPPDDSENLSPPDVLAAEIVEDLKAALEQFAETQADLSARTD